MANNLTQKEMMLLKDQKKHEEVCIQKYGAYASQAQNPQLQQLFNSLKAQEEQHLNTINQIMNGQTPSLSGRQNATGLQSASGQRSMTAQVGQSGTANQQFQAGAGQSVGGQQSLSLAGSAASQSDADLCNDMLMTEKYVSGAYDTAIFEFTDTNLRQALNHIQKEEQQHGEQIFNYMKSNNMYNLQ